MRERQENRKSWGHTSISGSSRAGRGKNKVTTKNSTVWPWPEGKLQHYQLQALVRAYSPAELKESGQEFACKSYSSDVIKKNKKAFLQTERFSIVTMTKQKTQRWRCACTQGKKKEKEKKKKPIMGKPAGTETHLQGSMDTGTSLWKAEQSKN